MEIKDLTIGFLLVALFSIAIILFGVNYASENNSNLSIIDDSRISFINTTLHSDIGTASTSANSTQTSFNQDDSGTILSGITDLFFKTITSVGKGLMSTVNKIFGTVFGPLFEAAGIPGPIRIVVLTVLSAIMAVLVTALAWRLYKQG